MSVTVKVSDSTGATTSIVVNYNVELPIATGKRIGMGTVNWAPRIAEVGPGVSARRIFGILNVTGDDRLNLVQEAIADNMLPVISYKVPNVSTAIAGGYNAWARAAAAKLVALDTEVAVTIWHEPYGDMTGAEFVAMQRVFAPIFQTGKLKFGPILNGWLLDAKVADFTTFTSPDLLDTWDWVGIDTYETGTMAAPGSRKPAMRVPLLVNFLASKGHSNMSIGIGEYNGFSAKSITDMGEALFSTPQVWFGCVWNTDLAPVGVVLTGDRLAAFKAILADPRAL